jgi:Immunoglobulin I-set domain/Immunoglobulin domain
MKKLIILLLSCLVSAPVLAGLSAGNPEYEPFSSATNTGGTSYTPGDYLAGQSRAPSPGDAVQSWWEYGPSIAGGNVATHQPTVAVGDLSVSNLYSVGGGQCAAFGGNGDSALMNLTTGSGGITGGTIYFSFALQFTNLTSADTNGAYFAGFCNLQSHDHGIGTPNSVGARVMVRSDGAGGFNIGLQEGGNNGASGFSTVWDPNSFSTSDIIFVVGSYTFNSGSANDVANLWVNPDASTFGVDDASAPAADLTSSGSSTDLARAASFVLLDQANNEPAGLMDDLRIGLDWADVTPNANFVKILQDPSDQNLPEGYTATFSIQADGAPPLTYQWVKDGSTLLSDGGNILGANSNVLTISNISSTDEGGYACSVTNGFGKFVLSGSAALSISSDPGITNQPQGITNDYGTTATFEVDAVGTAPFGYQWRKDSSPLSDGGNIAGSHSNVLTLTNVSYLDNGNYTVTVSNASGLTVQSHPAPLAVNDPFIVTQPVSATNIAGGTVTFQVVADGSPTLIYQWYRGGTFLFDGGNLSGSQTSMLTITNVSSDDATNYNVVVQGSASGASVTSSIVSLKITSPIALTAPPNPRTVATGDPAVFAAGVSGTGPFGYQWFLNGTNIPGATNFAYAVADAQTSNVGNYSVIISNAFSAVTSAPVALTVSNGLSLATNNLAVIRVGDGAQTLTVNGNSMFLDQYATNGNYVNTVTIPDSGSTASVTIGWDNINGVNSGSTTGSCLNRSLDGRYMVIAGYNTNLNYGDSLVNSFAAAVPRGIGLINSHGQYILAVSSTNTFNQTYWRAGITDGTNNFWGSGGNTGTYYFGSNAPAAVVQSLFANSRAMGLYNGNIYCAEASNPNGILEISGMPTNATTSTNYLFAGSTGTSDMAVSPDGNLIYVADQRATSSGGGVQRWEYSGSSWNLAYTLTDGYGTKGPRYVAADFSGANPVVYVTTDDNTFDNNRIVRTEDTGAGSTGVTLAYAGVNETFRGIHFGPVESAAIVMQPTLLFVRNGTNFILSWSGSFTLQSATNVVGPYSDVSSATSPYTNSLSAAGQMFFRLRN